MKTAQFKYRCRQCGEVFGGPLTGADNGQSALIMAVATNSHTVGSSLKKPALFEIHDCTKGGKGDPWAGEGIADLIGYELKG